jgi:RNA polymerase sigma factor (sigma-70 family)
MPIAELQPKTLPPAPKTLPPGLRTRSPGGDAALMRRVQAGDEDAFATIYKRHYAPLLSYCRHMLGGREEAEDALQQAFIRAHKALRGGSPPRELRPWLYAIARNCCLSAIAARRPTQQLQERIPSLAGLSEQVREREDLRELVADIGRLPEDQRSALLLAELDDLSHQAIATIVGCPVNKVKALVYQARSTLIAEREARNASCREIREQLSVARGSELRRGPLRRHLNMCAGCRDFQHAVTVQRQSFAAVLPVLPSTALAARILGHGALHTAGTVALGQAGGAAGGTAGTAAAAGATTAAAGPTAAAGTTAVAAAVGAGTNTGALIGGGLLAKVAVGGAVAALATVGAITVPSHLAHASQRTDRQDAAAARHGTGSQAPLSLAVAGADSAAVTNAAPVPLNGSAQGAGASGAGTITTGPLTASDWLSATALPGASGTGPAVGLQAGSASDTTSASAVSGATSAHDRSSRGGHRRTGTSARRARLQSLRRRRQQLRHARLLKRRQLRKQRRLLKQTRRHRAKRTVAPAPAPADAPPAAAPTKPTRKKRARAVTISTPDTAPATTPTTLTTTGAGSPEPAKAPRRKRPKTTAPESAGTQPKTAAPESAGPEPAGGLEPGGLEPVGLGGAITPEPSPTTTTTPAAASEDATGQLSPPAAGHRSKHALQLEEEQGNASS